MGTTLNQRPRERAPLRSRATARRGQSLSEWCREVLLEAANAREGAVMWRLVAIAAISVLGLNAQALVGGPEGDCGFSELHPRHMTHFVDRGAEAKVTPQYPPAAKARGLGGAVWIRVLVNKQGLVERTCPVYVRQEKKPDRSLVVAAEAAALHWIFKPNFGIEPAGGVSFDYVYDVILFQFDPAVQPDLQVQPR